ncbi:uncharacterized protein BJ212DRAFT_1007635 [Suillus subaureus]|uniref:Uncharacterized protein n=1 Tax=Suillus subaureus TaxID=48587 RepID=A0A9P7EF75_9AGAM|nr:uncharacterized protein BJ212DRAFT_1007635 [Suillus subaureus]KAG1820198.1 hypothetical protein BJ212DRAFT_1007635 [Suillus subaureus]
MLTVEIMISSPAKRLLTEDERVSKIGSEIHRNDATPSDVTASIRNAAMRVRKNVLEGYRTQPSAPSTPNSSPTKCTSASHVEKEAYPWANDALREVFASATSGKYTPATSSPAKRRRSESSDDISSDSESSDDYMDVERPMKPLRTSGGTLMAALGLPHVLTSPPGGAEMTRVQKYPVAQEHDVHSIMDVVGSASHIAQR